MIQILVTGANGQLGKEIQFVSSQFDKFNYIFTDIIDPRSYLDITNFQMLLDFFYGKNINYIINCAGYTAVDKAESEPEIARLINVTGTENLAKIAKQFNISLIHISTDYVFDGKNYTPYKETDLPNPLSVYGKTKYEGEQVIINTASEGTINYLIIRTSWLYSSFGNNFVKTILRRAKEEDELKIVFDQISSPTYARDLATAIISIITNIEYNKQNSVSGIYHYSNEGVTSWYDFAKAIVEIAKLSCHIIPIETYEYPTTATRPHYSVLNKNKIKNTYNLTIPHWYDSLKKCIEVL